MDNNKKITILARIAHELNEHHVTWAVGGSMLLYLQNITDAFRDIDLMVALEDVETVKELLLRMGTLEPSDAKAQYKTKRFLEFTVDGVDVDVMAGFAIVKGGITYDCALKPSEITRSIVLENEIIPLQSVDAWRRNYALMGKVDKVRMIDEAARNK